MNLRSISVRSRLIVLVAFALVLLAAVAIYSLMMEREQMLRDRQDKTRNIVELAHTLATYHASLANSGKMTMAEAQEQTRLAIRHMRFEGENYIVIVDTAVNTIEHPDPAGDERQEFRRLQGRERCSPCSSISLIPPSAARMRPPSICGPRRGQTKPVRKMSASKLFAPMGAGYSPQACTWTTSIPSSTGWLQSWRGLIGGAMVVLLTFAFVVTRSITTPISEAVDAATRLAEGDLTVTIEADSSDEVGRLMSAMQSMIGRLTQIISEVRTAADNLTNAAGQVSATAQSLSQASSEQAASVEETTSSMEQMTASISQNTENAKVTDGMASKAAREAAEGGERR